MNRAKTRRVRYALLELNGARYAVVPEEVLRTLAESAGHGCAADDSGDGGGGSEPLDADRLAQRLAARRRQAGLSQAELARRAGVRVETLNRIERGRNTPDFATIRKLVQAMSRAELELASRPPEPSAKGTLA